MPIEELLNKLPIVFFETLLGNGCVININDGNISQVINARGKDITNNKY